MTNDEKMHQHGKGAPGEDPRHTPKEEWRAPKLTQVGRVEDVTRTASGLGADAIAAGSTTV